MPVDLRRALSIDGWMSEAELMWLAVRAQSCRLIIEIGSHLGRSTAALSDHCPGEVVAIDSWLDPDIYLEFRERRGKNVSSMRLSSLEAELMLDPDPLADFIFIDADHAYASVRADIEAWRRHVRPGGILAGHDHDAYWPGVVRAVDEAFPERRKMDGGSIWWVVM